MSLGQVFCQVLQISPVSYILPVLHIYRTIMWNRYNRYVSGHNSTKTILFHIRSAEPLDMSAK